MLAHDGGTITCKTLWLGGGARGGDGRLARQEAQAAGAGIVRLGGAAVNEALASGRRRSRTGEATEVGSGFRSGDAYSSLMRDIICCFCFSGMLARSIL